MQIGIIGGGGVGGALGRLMQAAGHDVVVGVRQGSVEGLKSAPVAEAASFGDVVVLAVPYDALAKALPPLAGALSGKIVVDATNPVNADWSPLRLGEENSAAEEVARLLPGARTVKAFNTIFADTMRSDRQVRKGGARIACFIASDDADAAATVAGLAGEAGFLPVIADALAYARQLEALAQFNIALAAKGGTDAAILFDRAEG